MTLPTGTDARPPDRLWCPRCGTVLLPRAERCPSCGANLAAMPPPTLPGEARPKDGGPPLVAAGAALLLVVVGVIAAVAFVSLLPGQGSRSGSALGSASPRGTLGTAGPGGIVVSSRAPGTSATPSPEATITPTFAARLDGNPWYIKHEVATSTNRDAQPGDLLTRIYTVTYRCQEPPCDATISSDDPDTISPATANPFTWKDGAYVSTETYRDRCVTPDGAVLPRAYLVELTTTIRVTAAELERGRMTATGVEGSQVRVASAGQAAASCPDWRIDYTTTGSRNVQPGIATDFVSSNWAGYIAEPREGRVTHVQGSWVQPAITCPDLSNRFASFWIGIDGFRSETVQQLGTAAQCLGGEPSYDAWWEMYPDPAVPWDMAVRPGDEFSATIDVEGDAFTMTLQNVTTGESRTTTQIGPGLERSSAEWIAEPPYVCYTDGSCELAVLSDFGRVRFDDAFAAIDGGPSLPITDPAWQLARDNIETEAGRRVAETSTLSSDGTSFTVNWRPDR